ncbi:hypothetical protein [Ruegeria arenilitoris]|uniref:hypothetical protein n=1 Tax=Ruegeria arenilitoris TaxID=1173585 RepID=UPI0014818963|nr:hypothetical protein [Ruegeria arenilitoris]
MRKSKNNTALLGLRPAYDNSFLVSSEFEGSTIGALKSLGGRSFTDPDVISVSDATRVAGWWILPGLVLGASFWGLVISAVI